MYCGGNHLSRERELLLNTDCRLIEGETAHPSNYRGCRHTKERCKKRKPRKLLQLQMDGVFLVFCYNGSVLLSGASREIRIKEATTSMPGCSRRSDRPRDFDK
jgi:hypothetical protein